MKRIEFEHVIRAASAVAGVDRLIVIGSQAIHGQFPDPPAELLASIEADLVMPDAPDRSDLIDGAIGELSPFHQAFGYYGHGVHESVAVLPAGWRDRLVPYRSDRTGNATALCLEVHDLVVSKLAAGRPKDVTFVEALVRHGLIDSNVLRRRLADTTMEDSRRRSVETVLSRVLDHAPPRH